MRRAVPYAQDPPERTLDPLLRVPAAQMRKGRVCEAAPDFFLSRVRAVSGQDSRGQGDDMPMKRFAEPGQRYQLPAGRRRAMSAGLGILLIGIGAVLRFAVTLRSMHGLNVHIAGVILILAGLVSLLLPGSAWARLRPGWLRPGWLRTSWVSPGQPRPFGETAPRARPAGHDDGQPAARYRPAYEFDPPPEAPASDGTGLR